MLSSSEGTLTVFIHTQNNRPSESSICQENTYSEYV